MLRRAIVPALAAFAVAGLASAQGPGGGGPGRMHGGGPGFMGGFMPHEKVVTGAPYSADVSNQTAQTLNDGNTISHTTSGHVARDSQGRFYSQETISGGPFGNGPMTFTIIMDPVAGYVYRLNAATKTAMRHAIPAPGSKPDGAVAGRHRGTGDSANMTSAELGTQTINGVSATGISRTRTIPAGTVGNTQPIVSTSEVWTSPDLQVIVLAKRSDPRMGQSTYSLTNIQKGEPAANLFQVPADYTVRDAPAGMHGSGPEQIPPPPPPGF